MKLTRTTPRNPDSTACRNLHEFVPADGGVDAAGLISKSSLKGFDAIQFT